MIVFFLLSRDARSLKGLLKAKRGGYLVDFLEGRVLVNVLSWVAIASWGYLKQNTYQVQYCSLVLNEPIHGVVNDLIGALSILRAERF